MVGVELPVRFLEGPDLAVAWARSCGARWVVGLGVASRRDRVSVERFATRATCGRPDIDGFAPPTCGDGPEHVPASLDPVALARALDAELSDDAGGYVCNAWLYRVTLALPEARVGFVHLPPAGLAPEALRRALAAMDQASSSS